MSAIFKITAIEHGWFEIELGGCCMLTNSNYLGCDAPALLLSALCSLIDGSARKCWLCWQNEPSAQILTLERRGDNLLIEVFDADVEAYRLQFSDRALRYTVPTAYIAPCVP